MRFLLVLLVALPLFAQQQRIFHVTSAADSGPGSLHDVLLQANEECPGDCRILFQIPGATTPWITIRPRLPLPPLRGTLDGRNQTQVYGDTNPHGPEIEINGELAPPGTPGLVVEHGGVYGLAITGFGGPGIHATGVVKIQFNHIGADPTGTRTVPNERGIVLEPAVVSDWPPTADIRDNLIAGNRRAGVFAWSGGNVTVDRNRIEWNGASGVFMGPKIRGAYVINNVIGFNGHAGVSVAGNGSREVEISGNSLHANANLGIDYDLDHVSRSIDGTSSKMDYPEITSARYDAFTDTTIVEGFQRAKHDGFTSRSVSLFANDAPDPSGFGEGQYPLGSFWFAGFDSPDDPRFRITLKGRPPGRWIAATVTVAWHYYWLRGPRAEGDSQGLRTTTSEFGPTVEIQGW